MPFLSRLAKSILAKSMIVLALFPAVLLLAFLALGVLEVRAISPPAQKNAQDCANCASYFRNGPIAVENGSEGPYIYPNEAPSTNSSSEFAPIIMTPNGTYDAEYEETVIILDGDVPLFFFDDSDIVLFAPWGMSSWAPVNLILCLIGIAMANIATVLAIRSKARDKHTGDEPLIGIIIEEDHKAQPKLVWLTIGLAFGIVGVFLFLLTQDVTAPIASFDMWTIVHAIVLAIQATTFFLACKREKADAENKMEDRDKHPNYA